MHLSQSPILYILLHCNITRPSGKSSLSLTIVHHLPDRSTLQHSGVTTLPLYTAYYKRPSEKGFVYSCTRAYIIMAATVVRPRVARARERSPASGRMKPPRSERPEIYGEDSPGATRRACARRQAAPRIYCSRVGGIHIYICIEESASWCWTPAIGVVRRAVYVILLRVLYVSAWLSWIFTSERISSSREKNFFVGIFFLKLDFHVNCLADYCAKKSISRGCAGFFVCYAVVFIVKLYFDFQMSVRFQYSIEKKKIQTTIGMPAMCTTSPHIYTVDI